MDENNIDRYIEIKPKKRLRIGRILVLLIVIAAIFCAVYYDKTLSFADELIKNTGLASITFIQDEKIAAFIGEEVITMEELDAEYSKLPAIMQGFTSKADMLSRMVNQKILLMASKEANVAADEKEFDDYLANLKEQNEWDDKTFYQKLEQINMTFQEFKDETMSMLAIDKYLRESAFDDTNASDAEVQQYYDENIDKFKVDEAVNASHILVLTQNRTDEDALKIVAEIKSKLGSTDFNQLIKEYSEDPGQGTYTFGKGEMVPEFEQAAFSMKIGEVSAPVKTQYGYHIIKLLGKEAGRTLALDDVKEDIRMQVSNDKKEKKILELLETLKEKYKVSVNFKDDSKKQDEPQKTTTAEDQPEYHPE